MKYLKNFYENEIWIGTQTNMIFYWKWQKHISEEQFHRNEWNVTCLLDKEASYFLV